MIFRSQNYPGQELCTVYYAPINHLDVLFADGSWLPFFNVDTANQGAYIGREFAGRNAKGQRVFGLVSGSALATHVLADSSTLWEVPDKWTLEQASTISVAYVLVNHYYFLIKCHQMTPHHYSIRFFFNLKKITLNKNKINFRPIMDCLCEGKFRQMNQYSLTREQITQF